MEKIINAVSVFDNGETWPHGVFVFPEIAERGATRMVAKRWSYKGHEYEINKVERAFYSLEILPDETGFVAIDGNPGKHAYILNGDASVRFVLTPVFNMRGLDAERLALIRKIDEEQYRKYDFAIPDYTKLTCFHGVDTSEGKLEIFGDDGFGDCYYIYDWNTGELLSTRALPRRS